MVYAIAAGSIDFRTGSAAVGTPEYDIVQNGLCSIGSPL